MKNLTSEETKEVVGGFLPAAAAVIGAHYGYKFGRWLYKKLS